MAAAHKTHGRRREWYSRVRAKRTKKMIMIKKEERSGHLKSSQLGEQPLTDRRPDADAPQQLAVAYHNIFLMVM